jgi:hypothetical protein
MVQHGIRPRQESCFTGEFCHSAKLPRIDSCSKGCLGDLVLRRNLIFSCPLNSRWLESSTPPDHGLNAPRVQSCDDSALLIL